MFYFLIFHTSISASKTLDKKVLTTFLYGSVLYLILHGLIKASEYTFFKYIEKYFWTIIIIDIATLIYLTWDIIDYPGLLSRVIDTNIYNNGYVNGYDINGSGYVNNNEDNEIKPILRTSFKEHKTAEYQNEVEAKTTNTKKVAFNIPNSSNELEELNIQTAITQPTLTTAEDMGLTQSTSLDELGLGDDENKEPDGMNEFFSERIDVSDHVSNISDIDDINLDDFANNLA